MQTRVAAGALLIGLWISAGHAQAACGNITIAEMSWGSAGVAANIDKLILERGYDCTVTLVPGDTIPTFTSMITKAQPDMAPEFWINAVLGPLTKATTEERLILGAEILQDGAVEGWWVPKFITDAHPEIRSVTDALEHPELFPSPLNPEKGALHSCPADWSCRASTANLFEAFGAADKNFQLVESRLPEDLDASIAEAFRTQTGWLGYYWAPTAILGKYPMVKLSFGVTFNKAEWESCTAVVNCPSPQPNTYPASQAFTLVTQQFLQKAGAATGYIRARQWSNAVINSILAWKQDNDASNAETAEYFLQSHEAVWTQWVVPVIASRIKGRTPKSSNPQETK